VYLEASQYHNDLTTSVWETITYLGSEQNITVVVV